MLNTKWGRGEKMSCLSIEFFEKKPIKSIDLNWVKFCFMPSKYYSGRDNTTSYCWLWFQLDVE
jgi:hypothetical protein